jgi:hypothetical protein
MSLTTKLLAGASLAALAVGAVALSRRGRGGASTAHLVLPSASTRAAVAAPANGDDPGTAARSLLIYVVVPLWFAAGVADWLCHRATDIEETTGPKESLLHLLMLAEVSVPVLAGLFLEINSPVLALMIAGFLLHDATALWDVSYAVTRRNVTPIEQHVHSFLELLPLMAIGLLAVLHWPQFLALFGLGRERADWSLRLKQHPLPALYVAKLLGANVAVEWLPYLEELWRTLQASGGRLVPAGTPPQQG